MKAAIYSRKSKFTGKGESIENQVQLCKEYGEKLGITEFILYDKDEGFSGGNTNRPDFKRMMADAKAKKFDTLICYRLDRISRNIADFSALINALQSLNIGFISIREQFDTSTPMGRAMMYIASVFAQLERETIAERVRDNMLELAKTGRWLGGQTPLGYESKAIEYYDAEMKPRKMYKLSPINEELDIVKLIYQKYLEFRSLSQVYKYLVSNNIKTKGNKDWGKKHIQQVLTNPTYVKSSKDVFDYLESLGMTVVGSPDGKCGFLTYNKKQDRTTYKSMDEWIAAISKHLGVIESNKWLEVQKTLKMNKEKAPRLGKTNIALLTGLIRCSKCGSTMRVAHGRMMKNGEKAYYYVCTLKDASGGSRCDNVNIRGDEIEQIVINKLKEITADKGLLDKEIEQSIKELVSMDNTSSQIETIDKKIQDNESMIQNLVKQLSQNSDSSASKYIIAEIEGLNKSNDELNRKKEELKSEKDNTNSIKINMDVLLESLGKFNKIIDNCNVEEKRILISNLVDTIYWDGSTGEIEIKLWGMGKKK